MAAVLSASAASGQKHHRRAAAAPDLPQQTDAMGSSVSPQGKGRHKGAWPKTGRPPTMAFAGSASAGGGGSLMRGLLGFVGFIFAFAVLNTTWQPSTPALELRRDELHSTRVFNEGGGGGAAEALADDAQGDEPGLNPEGDGSSDEPAITSVPATAEGEPTEGESQAEAEATGAPRRRKRHHRHRSGAGNVTTVAIAIGGEAADGAVAEGERGEEEEDAEIADRIEKNFKEVQRQMKLNEAVQTKAKQVAEQSKMEEIVMRRKQAQEALADLDGTDPASHVYQKVNLELRVWQTAYDLQMGHENATVETKAQEVLAKNRTSFATVTKKLAAATQAMQELGDETTSKYQELRMKAHLLQRLHDSMIERDPALAQPPPAPRAAAKHRRGVPRSEEELEEAPDPIKAAQTAEDKEFMAAEEERKREEEIAKVKKEIEERVRREEAAKTAKLEAKLAKFQLDRQKLEQDLLETKEEEEGKRLMLEEEKSKLLIEERKREREIERLKVQAQREKEELAEEIMARFKAASGATTLAVDAKYAEETERLKKSVRKKKSEEKAGKLANPEELLELEWKQRVAEQRREVEVQQQNAEKLQEIKNEVFQKHAEAKRRKREEALELRQKIQEEEEAKEYDATQKEMDEADAVFQMALSGEDDLPKQGKGAHSYRTKVWNDGGEPVKREKGKGALKAGADTADNSKGAEAAPVGQGDAPPSPETEGATSGAVEARSGAPTTEPSVEANRTAMAGGVSGEAHGGLEGAVPMGIVPMGDGNQGSSQQSKYSQGEGLGMMVGGVLPSAYGNGQAGYMSNNAVDPTLTNAYGNTLQGGTMGAFGAADISSGGSLYSQDISSLLAKYTPGSPLEPVAATQGSMATSSELLSDAAAKKEPGKASGKERTGRPKTAGSGAKGEPKPKPKAKPAAVVVETESAEALQVRKYEAEVRARQEQTRAKILAMQLEEAQANIEAEQLAAVRLNMEHERALELERKRAAEAERAEADRLAREEAERQRQELIKLEVLRLKEEKDRRAQQLEALRVQQEMENPVLAKARKSTEEVDNAIAMLLKEVKVEPPPEDSLLVEVAKRVGGVAPTKVALRRPGDLRADRAAADRPEHRDRAAGRQGGGSGGGWGSGDHQGGGGSGGGEGMTARERLERNLADREQRLSQRLSERNHENAWDRQERWERQDRYERQERADRGGERWERQQDRGERLNQRYLDPDERDARHKPRQQPLTDMPRYRDVARLDAGHLFTPGSMNELTSRSVTHIRGDDTAYVGKHKVNNQNWGKAASYARMAP